MTLNLGLSRMWFVKNDLDSEVPYDCRFVDGWNSFVDAYYCRSRSLVLYLQVSKKPLDPRIQQPSMVSFSVFHPALMGTLMRCMCHDQP